MKVYLAARYSRREELLAYAADLEAMGHTVTSRWLQGNHQIDDQGLSLEAKAAERERFAREDYEDLMAADCCISFTEAPRSSNSRGGRHVEFGAALAAGKRVLVVGHRENVFHCLPRVEFYPTWPAAMAALLAQPPGPGLSEVSPGALERLRTELQDLERRTEAGEVCSECGQDIGGQPQGQAPPGYVPVPTLALEIMTVEILARLDSWRRSVQIATAERFPPDGIARIRQGADALAAMAAAVPRHPVIQRGGGAGA